jgi:hypothetical protein
MPRFLSVALTAAEIRRVGTDDRIDAKSLRFSIS